MYRPNELYELRSDNSGFSNIFLTFTISLTGTASPLIAAAANGDDALIDELQRRFTQTGAKVIVSRDHVAIAVELARHFSVFGQSPGLPLAM